MFSKYGKRFLRLLSLCIALIICTCFLASCKSPSLSPQKKALEAVGTVGEYTVNYEELYFLANNYKKDGMSADELWAVVKENIIMNYAILSLCDEVGVEYDEKSLEEDIQAYIDSSIESDFGGKRSSYISSLKESYMTDHYVRFIARVDLLYSAIQTALIKNGDIVNDEEEIIEYVKENFVRTWHIMIANDQGDDIDQNLEIAEQALADLKADKTTMFKLIGGKYNEDLLIPADGYAFARGSMEKAYEDAAFALDVNEYSDVVSAKGELGTGEYVDCYYVIQRLAINDEYINKNFSALYDSYANSVIAAKLEDTRANLEFVPNEYALSLDITDLEEIHAGTDVFVIVIIAVCVLAAAVVAICIIFIVRHFKNKKQALLAEKKQRAISDKIK